MKQRKLIAYLPPLLILCVALRVWLVWDALPERIASHFGASGQPNAFQDKQSFVTLSLGMMTLMYALFGLMPRLLPALPPRMVNVPNREYWLSPERREASIRKLVDHLSMVGVMTQLFMVAVYELVIRANLARAALDNSTMFVLLGLFYAGVISSIVRIYRDFRLPEGPSDNSA